MKRVLIMGLPRTGTTWLGRILSSGPDVVYIHEPDSPGYGLLPRMRLDSLGAFPALEPGDPAPNLRLVWELAFAGGWPDRWDLNLMRALATSRRVPRETRRSIGLLAARRAVRRKPAEAVVVKTVHSFLAAEWLAKEFDPRFVVVWRHPLNTVQAWTDRGAEQGLLTSLSNLPSVRGRFEGTEVWPPPQDTELEPWVVCALNVLLLERARVHHDWLVVNHEQQCVDPQAGFRSLFDALPIPEPADLAARIAETDRAGEGYATLRKIAAEPRRWRERLTPAQQDSARALIDRFAAVSPEVGTVWAASPALR